MTRQEMVRKAALVCLPVSGSDGEAVILDALAKWVKEMGEPYVASSLLGVFQDPHFVAACPGLREEMDADADEVRVSLRREVGQLIHRAVGG